MNNIDKLQQLIGYNFKDVSILKNALTHSSYANENNLNSYERLEFLGDAIIEMVVSEYIYENLNVDAGNCSRLRASLVSTSNLYDISMKLNLPSFAYLGNSMTTLSKKNTADLFESLVAAIYLDGGMDVAKSVINKFLIIDNKNIQNHILECVDNKSRLQEILQKNGETFRYELLNSQGLDHEKTFEVGLYVNGNLVSNGTGLSIQKAEDKSAENYLKRLK